MPGACGVPDVVQPTPLHPAPAIGRRVAIVPLARVPAAEVEALLDRAFEPGRHARTAYRIREGTHAIPALSLAALDGAVPDGAAPDGTAPNGTALVGTIQCWPVALTDAVGRAWPLVMVGPVAVDPGHQGSGIGRLLMDGALAAAARTGLDGAMALIGDPEYYGRFFGFAADRTGEWVLPGPFERRRLLARGADVPAVAGVLGPRVARPSDRAD